MLCCFTVLVASACAQTSPTAGTPSNVHSSIEEIGKIVTSIKLTCKKDDREFTVQGTGFLIDYRDPGSGKGTWTYLVTNRHVAFCWDEASSLPMKVKNISIRLSRKEPNGRAHLDEFFLSHHGNVKWFLPDDDAVDLAVIPITPDETKFDFRAIPADSFEALRVTDPPATLDGQTVLFAGFFQKFRRTKNMQPTLRQGRVVGMTPNGEFPLVGVPMKLYLADIPVFGGNSGSPVFINEGGDHNGNFLGQDKYRLVGIVNGFISQDGHSDLKLATTTQGTAAENSRVATMVPVDELSELLHGRKLQGLRDAQTDSQNMKSRTP